MKHPMRMTFGIIGWLIFGVAAGMYAVPRVLSIATPKELMNPYVYIIIIIGIVGFSTWAWLKMMRDARPESVDMLFSIGMGLISSRIVSLAIPRLNDSTIPNVLMRFAIAGGLAYLFWKMVKSMQKSWKNVLRYHHLSNFWTALVVAVAAVFVAVDISPWVAIALLIVGSIYDAWAVWKSKHMVKLATFFTDRRIIAGIGVPYKDKEKYAILGAGDIFFIVLVAASFFQYDPLSMYVTAFTMTMLVVVLFFLSQKNKFYPALPFIFAGLIVGIALRLLL